MWGHRIGGTVLPERAVNVTIRPGGPILTMDRGRTAVLTRVLPARAQP
jgi:hypothetical protein